MANEVNIKVTADDMASGKIKNIGTSVEKATDKLRAMRGPLLAVTGALSGLAVVGLKNASALGESINAVEQIFKDASETILEFSEVAATQAGLSMADFNQKATLTGALLQNFGLNSKEAADQTIRLATRAADLASVFDKDVGQAMNAINAALRGETEAIRNFGISLDDASMKSKAMAMGLAESEAELTRNEKAIAALEIIMEQSADAAGDFVNTSDSLANSTRIMKAEFTNVSAELGQNLIPLATKVVGILSTVVKFFGDMEPATQQVVVVIGGLVAGLGALGLIIPPVVAGFVALKTATIALTLAMAANPLGAIAVAITFLVGSVGIPLLIKHFDKVKEVFIDMANSFMSNAEFIANSFIELINIIIRGINQINIFGDDIDEMTEASFPRFGKGIEQITEKSNELADALAMDSEEIKNFSNISQEAIKSIVDQEDELNEALKLDLEERKEFQRDFYETASAARKANAALEKEAAEDTTKTFKDAFEEQLRMVGLLPAVIDVAGDQVDDPLRRAFMNFKRGSQVSEFGQAGRDAQDRMLQRMEEAGGFGTIGADLAGLPMLPGMFEAIGSPVTAPNRLRRGSGGGGFQKVGDVNVFVEGDLYGDAEVVNKVAEGLTQAKANAIIEPDIEI